MREEHFPPVPTSDPDTSCTGSKLPHPFLSPIPVPQPCRQEVQCELGRLAASLALCVCVPHQHVGSHSHNSQRHTDSSGALSVLGVLCSHTSQPCSASVRFLPLGLERSPCGTMSAPIAYLTLVTHSQNTQLSDVHHQSRSVYLIPLAIHQPVYIPRLFFRTATNGPELLSPHFLIITLMLSGYTE